MEERENKYEAGDRIYTKIHPEIEMLVRRYYKRIYYCKFADDLERKELALFEREIVGS